MRTPIYVVVGMHRAGTSTVARGLAALGVSLGDNLLPTTPDNPGGAFEDLDILQLNEALLAALDESWHSVRAFDERKLDAGTRKALVSRGRELLARKLGSHGRYGFKDPRTSRLLFYWREVFEQLQLEGRYVIASRNPLSVAGSLAQRDGFAAERCHLLWLSHMLCALRWTEGCRRVVVDYDQLVKKPAHHLKRIQEALGLAATATTPAALSDYTVNFLSKDLRHWQFAPSALRASAGVPAMAAELYRLLAQMALDEVSPDAASCKKQVAALWDAVNGLSPALDLAEEGAREAARLGGVPSRKLEVQLYLDRGQGFGERDSVRHPVKETSDAQSFAFDLGAQPGLRALRLDPLNESAVVEIEAIELHAGGRRVDLAASVRANAETSLAQRYFFETPDPQCTFADLDPGALAAAEQLTARLRYLHIGRSAVHASVHQLKPVLRDLSERAARVPALQAAIAEREAEARQRSAEIAQRDQQIAGLGGELSARTRQVAELETLAATRQRALEATAAELDGERARRAGVERALEAAQEGGRALAAELDTQTELGRALDAELEAVGRRLAEEAGEAADVAGGAFWRRAGIARTLWRMAESRILHRRFAFHLVPNQDLRPTSSRHAWRSVGEDPHFDLEAADGVYPRGWVLLRSSLERPASAAASGPKLYVDTGGGFAEESAIHLPVTRAGTVFELVRLPPRVAGLRWDPMVGPGELRQGPILISRIGFLERQVRMLVRVKRVMREYPRSTLESRGVTWRHAANDLSRAYAAASQLRGDRSVPRL